MISDEQIRKLKDPKFYIENFTKIKGKEPGLIPFTLNEAQKDFLNAIRKNPRAIVYKARQIGFSTLVSAFLYHRTITTPGTNTALIGYNADLTTELLDKVKTFYRTTPEELRPQIQYNSKHEISFPAIDSKILVLPSSENVGRGYTLHNVLCVSGNTRVVTKNFFLKKIMEIKEGDEIINGNGGFSPVKRIIKKKNDKKLINLNVYGSTPLTITEDHKILVREKITGRPIWKQAGEVKKGDYLAYPYFQNRNKPVPLKIPDLKIKRRTTKISDREVPITPELGLFFGWYLAEGTSTNNKITLSVHFDEVSHVLSVVEVIKPYVGKVSVYYKKGESKSAVITIHGKEFAHLVGSLFGHRAEEKTIPQVAWRWGWNVGYEILRGLIDGDGYTKIPQKIQITTISERLAVSVKRMMVSLRLGLPGIQENDNVSRYGVKSQKRYDVTLGGKGNYKLRRKLGYILPVYSNGRAMWRTKNTPWANQGGGYWKRGKNHYWALITSKTEAPYEEYVFDLSLAEEPHSFLTHAGVVSNCTELAFWDKADEKMLAIEAAVPTGGGKIIVESTPNGVGNLFHRMVYADNDYVKKAYGWWWHYTEDEIEVIRRRINDPQKFAQEYELEFLAAGRSVFDQLMLKKAQKGVLKEGDIVEEEDGTKYPVATVEHGLRVYKKPRPGRLYVAGVDVAEGVTGGDYSVVTFFDRETGEEVAFFRGYVPPDVFGVYLNRWGRMFNNALMAVESNNHGLTTITELKKLLYPQLYFRPSSFDVMGSPMGDRLGWRTTKVTRPLLIDDLAQAIRSDFITIHSQEILTEMITFVYNDAGNMVPQQGFHDDTIFSTGIAYQAFKVIHDKPLDQISYEKYLPDNFSY